MIREKVRKVSSGYVMLVVLLVAQLATAYWIYRAVLIMSVPQLVAAVLASVVVLIMWAGLFMIHPNEAKVLQLFGSYVGTAHEPGLKWANPFFQKTAVSTRVRNFESRDRAPRRRAVRNGRGQKPSRLRRCAQAIRI